MRVLLVEDDQRLATQIAAALRQEGYAVDVAHDGEQGEFLGATETYNAAILDLGLPGLDGLSVLRQWRRAGFMHPVLILTARGNWTDKVEGIDAGADDYMAKPFRLEELLARLRALIRRAHGFATPDLVCGPLRLDPRGGTASVDGRPLTLTAQEYKVLRYLLLHQGQIVSRADLADHIYALDEDRDSNTIEVFIGRLRRKLGVDVIETQRGLGYRLRPPPALSSPA
ncbi:response regulator transcription factor [Ferrovibrio sp.]|uniref:response regulator transcription factor n=1 Tax=Ferrovibrio sp. TaxID=1917215 RepID=UPI0025B97B0F|nr:response regulator transcription factor [Ferrovibrio sp.]MBX3455387.1 response regulator transcription factor [Ferrovibrio sp.]